MAAERKRARESRVIFIMAIKGMLGGCGEGVNFGEGKTKTEYGTKFVA